LILDAVRRQREASTTKKQFKVGCHRGEATRVAAEEKIRLGEEKQETGERSSLVERPSPDKKSCWEKKRKGSG